MRTRAERNRGFESVKQNLFDAGVAVLNAAEAQEQLFDASVKALAEAVGAKAEDHAEIDSSVDGSSMNSIREKLMVQRQEAESAGDFDSYVNAEQKLHTLDELEVVKLEREARKLEAQIRIRDAQKQLSLPSQTPNPPEPTPEPKIPEAWTESKLKEDFKTLDGVRKEFSVKAKSWKEAVDLVNRRKG
jgi:hypothetical protein